MHGKVLWTTVALAAVALAGCADEPPSGTIAAGGPEISVTGTVSFVYNASENPYDAGDGTTGEEGQLCALDMITGQDPTGSAPTCRDPRTEIMVDITEVPDPMSKMYHAFLVGPDGEREIGMVQPGDENGTYSLYVGIDGENLEGMYTSVELRADDFVLATAGTAAGGNNFERAANIASASFEGSYTGKDLTLTTSGFPENATYQGWLVLVAEDGSKTHDVSFTVLANGETTFTATDNLNMWQEVHVHVSGTAINLGVSTIE